MMAARRRSRDEQGAVAILVAVIAVALFVVAAMVVDLGLARDTKRQSARSRPTRPRLRQRTGSTRTAPPAT